MSTLLKTLFRKPVDRAIEGVIKADDDSGLRNEVEEYVITGEVMKRLDTFLDSYNNYENANGVWISGFFGSGKSHLLKMLSMLLEQRDIEGCDIVEEFQQKLDDNEFLKGALRKAVSVPSKSILFNIDQKSDVISKDQTDALIAVFVKVFDEACGYYGKQPYIAQFERQLDQDGLLADFKTEFEQIEGRSWDWGRERINRVSGSIDQAHAKVTGATTTNVIANFRNDYRLSIEDFAKQVNDYVKRQPGKGFRLNFYVDEVGQYIADNTKLMTNLQTVAESLNTKCKGRAWIVVTAQKDMNTVVGEMTKDQANDFSKIAARFANRMNLASQDVAEVIQERLLKKKEEKRSLVGTIYDQQFNNFKTLFDFTDDSRTYKNYRSKDHFIDCYPFVPYQFDLFQACIQNLSLQNAFEGKHQSVGERSMLGVFQDVAKQIADHELGELATFDLMFEGIRATLKGQIQSAVLTAERNLENKLAVRLLKTLFLVKYVREFKATIRNLSVLMLDSFDTNVGDRKKAIEEALSLLETETYIQRNGELYEFLTDEEKDIEQEIKNTDVDTQEVYKDLSNIIFDGVLRKKKLRHEETKRDFDFTRKLDDRLMGREHHLAVHVVSPFADNVGRIDQHKMETMGSRELRVVLDADDRLVRELMLYKKTDKYVSQNVAVTQKESHKRILGDKSTTNSARKEEIKKFVSDLLGRAKLFVHGQDVECGSQDPATRIQTGFERLIESVYTNLGMLQKLPYSEDALANILSPSSESLITEDTAPMSEAELEVQSLIQRETNKGQRTTMKSLCDQFEGGSYGWPLAAVQCVVATLVARGKLEAKIDNTIQQDRELVAALKNTRGFGNMLLEPQVAFTPSQMARLKEFYSDFFDSPPTANEPVALGKEIAGKLEKVASELGELMRQRDKFPFLSQLESNAGRIKKLPRKSPKYFLTEFDDVADNLLDFKEDTLDPIRTFMRGSQAEIFLEASDFLARDEKNLRRVDPSAADELRTILSSESVYRGRTIQDLKSRLDDLKKQVAEKVGKERDLAAKEIQGFKEEIVSLPQFKQSDEAVQQQLTKQIEAYGERLKQESLISEIREARRDFETRQFNQLVASLDSNRDPKTDAPAHIAILNLEDVAIPFSRPYVESEEDVASYIELLKTALLQQVRDGKRIRV